MTMVWSCFQDFYIVSLALQIKDALYKFNMLESIFQNKMKEMPSMKKICVVNIYPNIIGIIENRQNCQYMPSLVNMTSLAKL